MSPKKVTMTDIAKALGLSQATVSIVLNGKGDKRIAAETRENVIAAAQKMGYKNTYRSAYNFADSLLYITDDITDSQMAPYLMRGAENRAKEQGVELIVLPNLLDHQEGLEDIVKAFKPHAIILTTSILREISVHLPLDSYNVVLLNCIDKFHHFPSIMPDDRFGAQEAVESLIQEGVKNIACITGDSWMMGTQSRVEGYKLALMTNNIAFNPAYIHHGDWSLKAAYDATLEILEKQPEVEAIFSFSDFMSQGVYYALKEKGKIIGEHIKVISFDNHEVAAQLNPPLSTVELPHEKMGELAVDYLISKGQSGFHGSRIVLPCPFIKRQSS